MSTKAAISQETERASTWTQVILAAEITVSLRIFYSVFAAFSVPFLKLDPAAIQGNYFHENVLTRADHLRYAVIGVWQRFDTLWYVHIAQHGYDQPASVVFNPVYPLLIRVLTWLGTNPYVAAVAISTTATFALLWGMQRLLLLDLSAPTVRRTIFACVAWPASFIFFAGYAESLVTALIIWSILFARQGRWLWAALLGILAAATKTVGILVLIPLVMLVMEKRDKSSWPVALIAAFPVLWAAWIKLSGHPFASEAYHAYWRTELAFPWTTLGQAIASRQPLIMLNLAFLVMALLFAFRARLHMEYVLFSAGAVLLFLTKNTDPLLQSSMRYVLVIFPAYAGLAHFRSRLGFALLLGCMFVLNLKLFLGFLDWQLVV